MTTAKRRELISVEAYLGSEKTSAVKHEYVHGRLFAMAGASDKHNRIVVNLIAQLYTASEASGCQLYASDMKLRTAGDVFYYPDLMAVCAADDGDYFKTKPCLVVEVLSRSTAAVDKREKLEAYLALPSLKSCLLIDAETRALTGYDRTSEGWLERQWSAEETVDFACLDVSLAVNDIYRGIAE